MKLLITAGPTREPIDRVRFISNRSSGKMGLAIARAGVEAGHDVTLLAGPGVDVQSVDPRCNVHRFETGADLLGQLQARFPDHDVLIMAAAVSDYRPANVVDGKLPREGDGPLTLELESTPDISAIMAESKRADQRVVAFALEMADRLVSRATEKLKRKGADAIVANPLETMDGDDIEAVWLTAAGTREHAGRRTKVDFARWLIAKIGGDLGLGA